MVAAFSESLFRTHAGISNSMNNKTTQNVLVVDDEPDIRELLEITLTRMGTASMSAANISEAKKLLREHDFSLCLTDMKLGADNGIELVHYIQEQYPDIPIAMITAHGNMESAIEALKAGAYDFVSKPIDLQILRKLVSTALQLNNENRNNKPETELKLLGESPLIQKTRATISKLARSQAPVYISGESGVGKELVARLIHLNGPRHEQAFVPVNCGAIPGELMESEFFGHKKGSFTGANNDKQGLFHAANDGTLFLDEVAELPLHMQVKLLRAIQEMAIRPIGSNQEISINVRILSATHKNLVDLVKQGLFRQDLYYRINVIELQVPSLRERTQDIPLLVEYFLQQIAHKWQSNVPTITNEAMRALMLYSFPGNVRELENILERAMTLCDSDTIQAADLSLPDEATELPVNDESSIMSLDPALMEKEKEVIIKALEKTRYNKTAAAKLLGISFRALRYRIKKLGIE